MPELVENKIIPSTLHSCLVLNRQLPETMSDEARAQLITGLWDMAKKDDMAFADTLLAEPTGTPFDVEIFVTVDSDLDFITQSSVAVIRNWIDGLRSTKSEPCYRIFTFPSHFMIGEQRYDFNYTILAFGDQGKKSFGNQSERPEETGTDRLPHEESGTDQLPENKKPWWRFW